MPEYGRHIQKLVDEMAQTSDRDLRNSKAKAIINIMGNINPQLRDSKDFAHKLWDHLYIMADFNIDIDCPYGAPTREDLAMKPRRMNYPARRVEYRHYGKYAVKMVQRLCSLNNQEVIDEELPYLVGYMHLKRSEFNNDNPTNGVIVKDIKTMTDYTMKFDEMSLINVKNHHKSNQQQHRNSNNGKQRRAKNSSKGKK
jgi:hypothetical protein